MSNLMETKIVIWTIGGSIAVATLLFAGKVIIAIHMGIEMRVDAWAKDFIGTDGNLVKAIAKAIWEQVKGGGADGS